MKHHPDQSSYFQRHKQYSVENLGRIYAVLEQLMRDGGCSENRLQYYRRRRHLLALLEQARRNITSETTLSLMNQLSKRFVRCGIESPLASGNWGAVYRTTDNKVLKLTKDRQEAIASMQLVGKHHEYLADVYHVCRITVFSQPTPFHLLHREYIHSVGQLTGELAELGKRIGELHRMDTASNTVGCGPLGVDTAALKVYCSIKEHLAAFGIQFHDYHVDNLGSRDGQLCVTDLSLCKAPDVFLPTIDLV